MVVLIVTVALFGLGMAGLFLTGTTIQLSTNINLRSQALIVAEAGIERARAILNNPGWMPPVPELLAGSGNVADEIPNNMSLCQGQARGAILVDLLQYSPPCTHTPCALQNIAYPSVNRTAGLPHSAGRVASGALGTYTVYIRQDLADCRMGNFTCETAPPSPWDAGIGGALGATTCSPPAGLPSPNGAVVVRSEGIAADGRTRVALEVTLTPSQGIAEAHNTPMSALCTAGVNGCDDNSSVQNGIVVNSNAPQTPPSSGGISGFGGSGTGGSPGSGGTSGTGGTTGAGGAGGTGTTSPGFGVGGSGGSGTGGHGTGGTGGSGAGGSSSKCGFKTCTASQTCCNNECVDIKTDNDNCGTCGLSCPDGKVCVNGSCRSPCLNYAISAVAPCPGGFTPGCITINRGSLVDSYNRNRGSYGPSNKGSADIAMTCTQANDTCPNNCSSGCITGAIDYGQAPPYDVNTLPAPPHATNSDQLIVPPNKTLQPGSQSIAVYYHEIDLNQGGTLTLAAGLYVVSSLNLNGNSTLYIDDSQGPVRLWVLSAVSPNSTVTVKSGNPADFWLIYNGTSDVNNNSNNNFTGIFFAPGAHVNLNYVVTGAVIGGSVTLNGTSAVHFDTTLECP